MTLLADQQAALEPLCAELLRRATEQGRQIVDLARDEAAARITRAASAADAAVAQAEADGAAQASPVAAAELGRSRQAARSAALSAATRTHDELAARIRAAVVGLRDGPGYAELRDRLATAAARAAGPAAEITDHPDGGVVARARGVVVDCSLPRLADRVADELAPRIARLCGQ